MGCISASTTNKKDGAKMESNEPTGSLKHKSDDVKEAVAEVKSGSALEEEGSVKLADIKSSDTI